MKLRRHSDTTQSSRPRHPVGSFLLIVVLIAVALVALWTTGAVAPQIRSPRGLNGMGDTADGARSFVMAEITNEATLPVEITDVRWPTTAFDHGVILLGRPGDSDFGPSSVAPVNRALAVRSFKLAGGESRMVFLTGQPRCGGGSTTIDLAAPNLVVRARPVAGPTRSVRIRSFADGVQIDCPSR